MEHEPLEIDPAFEAQVVRYVMQFHFMEQAADRKAVLDGFVSPNFNLEDYDENKAKAKAWLRDLKFRQTLCGLVAGKDSTLTELAKELAKPATIAALAAYGLTANPILVGCLVIVVWNFGVKAICG